MGFVVVRATPDAALVRGLATGGLQTSENTSSFGVEGGVCYAHGEATLTNSESERAHHGLRGKWIGGLIATLEAVGLEESSIGCSSTGEISLCCTVEEGMELLGRPMGGH